jgi:hypothetical protein
LVALTPTRLIAALQKSEEEAPPWTPDKAKVRQKFNHYDTNNSGNLDENEVMALAQDLWMAFHPKAKPLDFMHVKELTKELIQVPQHQIKCHSIMRIGRHCQSVNHPQALLAQMRLLE